MESAANYLEGIDIEGYSCIISLKDDGTNRLQILKDKKLLKSVPAKLKKHPQYLEIAEVSKAWKAQHRRARFLLEDMMQRRTPLAVDDVRAILSNPVVSPMFKKLVLLQDEQFGLPHRRRTSDVGWGEKVQQIAAFARAPRRFQRCRTVGAMAISPLCREVGAAF